MTVELASGYIQLIPSLRGAGASIEKQLGSVGQSGGRAAGGLFAGSFAKSIAPLAGIAAAAIGAGAVGKFFSDSIGAASDLQQSLGGVDAIFGKSAAQIHDWAKGAQTSVGLSENAYNSLASVIGSQLKNAGTSMDKVGVKTDNLIKQGADLAATFGGTTADAVEAISSALKGETDPIERYGVSLTAAAVNAKGASLGFKAVGGNLSTAGKQAATMALILDQTASSTGQFAAQTNTLAEQQQIFGATLENVKAKIGTAFLPAITAVVGALSKELDPILSAIQPHLDAFAAKSEDVGKAITSFFSGLNSNQGSPTAISAPLDSFAAAGARVKDAIAAAQPVLSTYFDVLKTIGPLIGEAFSQIGPAVGTALATLGPALAQVIPPLAKAVVDLLPSLVKVVLALIPIIPPLAQIISALAPVISVLADGLSFLLNNVITPLIDAQSGLDNFFLALASGGDLGKIAGQALKGAFGPIPKLATEAGIAIGNFARKSAEVAGNVTSAIANIIGGFIRFGAGVGTAIGKAVGFIAGLPGKARAVLGNVGSILFNSGKSLIGGFINGISSMIGAVGSKVSSVLAEAAKYFPHSPAEKGPFSGSGWTAVEKSGAALATQFTGGFNAGVVDFGGNLGRIVPDTFSSSVAGTISTTGQAARTQVLINNKTNVRLEDLIDVQIVKNGEAAGTAQRLGYQPLVFG